MLHLKVGQRVGVGVRGHGKTKKKQLLFDIRGLTGAPVKLVNSAVRPLEASHQDAAAPGRLERSGAAGRQATVTRGTPHVGIPDLRGSPPRNSQQPERTAAKR